VVAILHPGDRRLAGDVHVAVAAGKVLIFHTSAATTRLGLAVSSAA
jgi:hypothetical protein